MKKENREEKAWNLYHVGDDGGSFGGVSLLMGLVSSKKRRREVGARSLH